MRSGFLRLAVVCAAAALPAAAFAANSAPKAKKKRAAPPASADIAAGVEASSPALAVSTPPANVDQLFEHFQYIDRNLNGLSARFIQSVQMPQTGTSQTVEGTVDYLRPDRLHLEHLKPERQTVVSDGKIIWIYRRDQNQVIQSNLDDWRKADPVAGRLLDFGNYAALIKNYAVAFDSKTLDVSLRPKDAKEDFELRLHLSGPALFPATTELSVGQMRIKTAFEDIRINRPLPEKIFVFTPPEGADVFRNFKPPLRREKTQ